MKEFEPRRGGLCPWQPLGSATEGRPGGYAVYAVNYPFAQLIGLALLQNTRGICKWVDHLAPQKGGVEY